MTAPTDQEPPRTAGEMVTRAREFLQRRGIEEWRLEAELLVAHALGLDRLRLFMALDKPVSADEIERARALLVRRGKREPTAYIVGEREFYGRSFQVGPGVLVPRPETELLVDRAREIAKTQRVRRAFDWGTGSGCIAITLAHEIDGLVIDAVDASAEALSWARRNLERHQSRVERSTAPLGAVRSGADVAAATAIDVRLHHGDGCALLAALVAREGPFDLVVANPPYIAPSESATLAPEVRDHEPHAALFTAGNDPDAHLRGLFEALDRALTTEGVLLVELGHAQAARARELATERGLALQLHRDFGGHERLLEARRIAAG